MDVSDYFQHLICICICCCCYTTAITRTSLPHLSSNLFQHLCATFGTHITTFNTRISSPLFFKHLSVLPLLNSIANCFCGCNARLPPRTHSISHPLGVFILPFRAPTSWIPLHRLARRLDRLGNHRRRLLPHSGTSEVIPISRTHFTNANTNLEQYIHCANTHRICCRRSDTSTGVLHECPLGWRQGKRSPELPQQRMQLLQCRCRRSGRQHNRIHLP